MSCTYADGLSPYENKGILGVSEIFNSKEDVKGKCSTLAKLIKEAKHVVVHTGAGISTSAGIPDFRGPNGVWTLEEKGLKPTINISFSDAQPTKTHMALKQLMDKGMVHYIVSQNIDGLHLKSGIKREMLAELHGNMFIDQCNFCKRQFVRSSPAPTVGQRTTGVQCHGGGTARKPCRGKLHDTILDWEHSLPDDDLDLSDKHSCIADLSICLGTTLQINPSGSVPLNTLRYGGKLVICNLQPTKHDNKADLIINTYVDDIFEEVMKLLNISIPEYKPDEDPVFISKNEYIEWTIPKALLGQLKKKFKKNCDGGVKKRVLVKKEYKEQQEELRNRTKALKKLQKLKTKRSNLMKRPRINDLLNDDVIELSTSDEDDVNIVNDSRNDVDMESITKDIKEAETDGLIAKCKEDAKTSLKEETVKIFQSSIEEEHKLDSNKVKSLLDEVLIKPDNSLELLAKDEPVVKDESEVILNALTEDKTEICKATIKEEEPKNNSESIGESQDNENMDSCLGVSNGKINTFKNEMECEGIKTNNLSSEKHEFSAKADDIISSL